MTLDDFHELMRFHVMMSDYDLSGYTYAAVDEDKHLFIYKAKPELNEGTDWLTDEDELSDYMCICKLHDFPKESIENWIIEL